VSAAELLNGAAFLAFIGLTLRTEARITRLETLIDAMRPPAKPGKS